MSAGTSRILLGGVAEGQTPSREAVQKVRVFVAAENRLLREALAHALGKRGNIEVIGVGPATALEPEELMRGVAEILLLSSRGNLTEDLAAIQRAGRCVPRMHTLLIGMRKDEGEFLQCVRAGIRGYMLRDASADQVVEGILAVEAGEAVCPGELSATLFRYFEREGSALPSASVRQRLGLTRREQQLIPLIAKGLTNKEIARHFCLSEQTVKNHVYRMKHKVGAEDRLDVVKMYRTHGFLL